jgi:hypothetical protein
MTGSKWTMIAALCGALFLPRPAMAQLPYAESFDGTDGAPWPAPWTSQSFYLTVSDLESGRGRMSGQSANGSGSAVARMLLPGFAETGIEALMTLEFENVANQGIGFYARQNGGTLQEYTPFGQGYAMFLKGAWVWPEDLGIWREIGGVETQFATGYDPVAGGLQNGVRYRARFRVSQHAPDSTRIQAKVWPEAASEPAPWTVDVFDSHPQLQATPGSFALDVYNFQGTAHIWIDDLSITGFPPVVSVPPADAARVALSAPWPNPVTGTARIVCALPAPGRATVRLFDSAGRRVADVFEGELGAGATTLEWRAVDRAGRRIAPGLYWLRLESGAARVARRIVVAE